MVRLLILSCGTNANWHVLKTLREKFSGEFYLIGTDTNAKCLVPSAKFLDAFYQVPPTANGEFLGMLATIIEDEKPQYIWPSFDGDQLLLCAQRELLAKYGVRSLGISGQTAKVYSDKKKMMSAIASAGFPVPKIFSTPVDLLPGESYCVKPIHGVGSIGVCVRRGIDLIGQGMSDDVIIQEVCSSPEVTMECFAYKDRFSAICRERLASKAGVCTKARIFKSQRLEAIGRKFASVFETPMFFNLQFMKSDAGDFVITDVNLRTAGGMGLSYAAGWDEASAIAKVMLGCPVDDVMSTLPEFVQEQYVVRVYEDIQTKVEPKTVAFDFDGTLLDSRARHRLVMDDVLRKFNVEIDTSGLVAFKRCGGNNVDFLVSKGVSADVAKKIQQDWISKIEDFKYLAVDVLYEDAEDLISRFAGWRKVLVTARNNEDGVARTLERLGIEKLFDGVHVVKPGSMCSMDKAQILKQEKALLFYGDTNSDYMASVVADVPFRYRECGFHSRDVVYSSNNNS